MWGLASNAEQSNPWTSGSLRHDVLKFTARSTAHNWTTSSANASGTANGTSSSTLPHPYASSWSHTLFEGPVALVGEGNKSSMQPTLYECVMHCVGTVDCDVFAYCPVDVVQG